MEKIYVFGHRNPDTDSVCSAISLSYLKNKLGLNTVPVILSDINNETKFALEYFNVNKPMFLNDVKLKIKDLEYRKKYFINEYESVYSGYQKISRLVNKATKRKRRYTISKAYQSTNDFCS